MELGRTIITTSLSIAPSLGDRRRLYCVQYSQLLDSLAAKFYHQTNHCPREHSNHHHSLQCRLDQRLAKYHYLQGCDKWKGLGF